MIFYTAYLNSGETAKIYQNTLAVTLFYNFKMQLSPYAAF